MDNNVLLTTSVGSFPKPDYLKRARTRFQRGEMSLEELRELEQRATREWIDLQEELGVDVLVDGEMYRGDMATYFAENMEGFAISGLVRSYGNRYYRKPIITGEVRRPKPITVGWWKWSQALTKKPLKAIITGPYTMMDWSFIEHYSSRHDACLALAEVLHGEVADLERAGAQYIQIDEPALSVRTDELELALEAMSIVTKGIRAKTLSHMCYGTFDQIYPKLLELAVDQLDLEMANSDFDLLDVFAQHPFTKEIGLGVFDVHSHEVPSVEKMRAGIEKALKYLKPEQIYGRGRPPGEGDSESAQLIGPGLRPLPAGCTMPSNLWLDPTFWRPTQQNPALFGRASWQPIRN
jgi:5-methyltetrahydropteroyltriglutamate--homocysteine methyltransferase